MVVVLFCAGEMVVFFLFLSFAESLRSGMRVHSDERKP